MHKYITILDTLDVLLKKDFNLKIIVNSKIFYNLLKENKHKKKFFVELSKESKLDKKNYLSVIKSIFFNFFIFLYIKIFVKKNYFKLKNFDLTLIDTF